MDNTSSRRQAPLWILLLLSVILSRLTVTVSSISVPDDEENVPWMMRRELSASATTDDDEQGANCPLDFTVVDWNSNTGPSYWDPSGNCNQTCCEYVYSMFGLILSPYIANTSNLMLPSYDSAQQCITALDHAFQEHQLAPPNAMTQCGVKPSELSVSPDDCGNIRTVEDLRQRVNLTAIDADCSGSALRNGSVDCGECSTSIANAYVSDVPNIEQADDGCQFLFVNYAVSVLNSPAGNINITHPSAVCVGSGLLQFVQQPDALPPGSWNGTGNGSGSGFPSLYKAGFAAGAAAIVVAILLAVSMHMSRRFRRFARERDLINQQSNAVKQSVSGNTSVEWFSYDHIKMATSNFCPSNLIGKGGYGTVYKGTLVDGTEIAVKKFQNAAADVFGSSFVPELEVISQVRHPNLVVLRGCSIAYGMGDGHQLLLVYDYMPNGSLKDYLFDVRNPPLLWPQRRNITIGIATGLAYLHHESKPAIIHRDVKAANILLDKNLDALVADFGLAKFKPEDITHFTTRVAGTLGYVAPEYALYGQLTNKTDVYSFGILLLELISGRRALNMFLSSETMEDSLISNWAYNLLRKGNVAEIVDEKMRHAEKSHLLEMERFIKVGLQCAHSRITSRPTMLQALRMLKGEVPVRDITDFSDPSTLQRDSEPVRLTVSSATTNNIFGDIFDSDSRSIPRAYWRAA